MMNDASCSTQGKVERSVQKGLFAEHEWMKDHGRPKRRCEDNIKTDHRDVEHESMDCFKIWTSSGS